MFVALEGNFAYADSGAFDYAINELGLGEYEAGVGSYPYAIISSFAIVSDQGFATTNQRIGIGKVTGFEGEELVKLVVGETSISGELNRADNRFFKHLEDEDQLLGGVLIDGKNNGVNSPELLKTLDVLVDGLVLIGLAGLGTDFGENGGSCDPSVAFDLNFGDGSALKIRGGGLSRDGINGEPGGLGGE
ncbi:hypothetical protein ES703_110834 [subsurface metagenome]